FPKPRDGDLVVPADTNPLVIKNTNVVFAVRATGVSGDFIVPERKTAVRSRSQTIVVHGSKPFVRVRVSQCGSPSEQSEARAIVFRCTRRPVKPPRFAKGPAGCTGPCALVHFAGIHDVDQPGLLSHHQGVPGSGGHSPAWP